MLFLVFIVILIGSGLPLIKFYFKGLAGIAIAFIDESLASTTSSLVSICTSIINGVKKDDYLAVAGVVFLQIVFIMFALIVPLMTIIALAVLWAVPLTLREQLNLHFAAEVLSAWEALIVFVFSCVAAVLQISQLAQFIVNNATGGLCKQLENFNPLVKLFPTDPSQAKCFDVIAEIQTEGAVLIAAAVMSIIVSACVFRLSHAALHDRELAMRRKAPHSPGEMTGLAGFLVRRALEPFGASQVGDAGGNMAQMYAQQAGVYGQTPSMGGYGRQPSNPVMARELAAPSSMGGMHGGMASPNPMYGGFQGRSTGGHGGHAGAHASIDV